MRFLSAAPLLALVPAVLGQDTTILTDLLQSLTSSGLTRLSSIAAQLNSTTAGQSLLSQLSSGASFVLFAPTDNAFNSASSNITSDADILSSVIAYHVVQGNFTGISTTYPNTTVGRTLLNNSTLVQLEGNKNQAVAWAARADGKVHVLNQRNDSIVSNTTTVGNITINIVDHVLNIPQSLAVTVPADNVSLAGIDTALKSVQLSTNQSGSAAFFDILNTQLHGFTFFAPNTSAIQAAASSLSSLQSNTTALQALFQNHLINGSTVYSPELSGQNFTSAAGEPLSFVLNATGHFVTSGNVTAQIVQPDVLLPNGVLHVIDRVLLNTQVDSGAASSAASSASSVATQSTSATAPIGFPATATLTGPGGSAPAASGSGGSGNAAAGGYLVPSMAQVVSVGVAVLGVVAGGRLVLA